MSSTNPPTTTSAPSIATTLKSLLSTSITSCTFRLTRTRVLSPPTISLIATVPHIRAYVARDPDPENILEIGRFPPSDLDRLATKFASRAPRLFVLTVAYDYPTMFLHHMIENLHYDEGMLDAEETLMHRTRRVARDHRDLRDRVLREQALVCAPQLSRFRFDHRIIVGALPFRKAVENDERKKMYKNALRGWDVELGREFQEGEGFGFLEFVLTMYSAQRKGVYANQRRLRGRAVAGFEYDEFYYLLWERGDGCGEEQGSSTGKGARWRRR